MENTESRFQPLPMSAYSESSQPKTSLSNIYDVPLSALQDRVAPRQVGTGNNRGEMTVKGLIRVVDTDTTVRLVMGYRKETF